MTNRFLPYTIACFPILLATPVAITQTVQSENSKLIAADIQPDDHFGESVDIHHGRIIIGAPSDWDNAIESGSAYLFNANSGTQIRKFLASDAQDRASFGESVAMNDDFIVISAPHEHCANTLMDCGAVYVYDANLGTQLYKLEPEAGFNTLDFGRSVAIEGSTIVVGAARETNSAGHLAGAAYVFDALTGQQLHHFHPTDTIDGDVFGSAVAIDNGIIAISAPYQDQAAQNSGAVYIYDSATGTQLNKILPENPIEDGLFGVSIAIENNVLLVGSTQPNINFPDIRGAFLHDITTGEQLHALLPSVTDPDDRFGISVALNQETAVVGAWASGMAAYRAGALYTFDIETGTETGLYLAADAASQAALGYAVAIQDNLIAAGAYQDNEMGTGAGAAYTFTVTNQCDIDLNMDGSIDFFDISIFLNAFNDSDPVADINQDGAFDFFDVSLFLSAFNAGCP